MQEWHLAISRDPTLESNTTRPGPNSTISRCFAKYGKRWQRRKSFRIWSGLSESNRHLNLGKSAEKGLSRTYEALSGTLSSPRSGQKRLMFLRLFPRNEEYRSGSDVPRGMRVGTLHQNREEVQSDRMHDTEDIGRRDLPIAPEISCS